MLKEKYELLSKPSWTYRDIQSYFGIKGRSTAIRLKNRAINENCGAVVYGTQYASIDSILGLFGTTREREIEIIRKQLNEKKV